MVKIQRFLSLAAMVLLLLVLVPLALAQGENQVEVTLVDGQIQMVNSIPAGPTTFMVVNNGTTEHSLEIEGNGVEEELEPHLQPGQSGTLTVDLPAGTYEAYCPVGNHQAEGMTMQLTVTEAAAPAEQQPAAPAQQQPAAPAQQPGALPATGEVRAPGTAILLLGLGLLVLVAGVGLALARRR